MAALVHIAAPNDNMEHRYMFTITFDHKGMNVTSQPLQDSQICVNIHVYSHLCLVLLTFLQVYDFNISKSIYFRRTMV
jgi:hypothetical protein